MVEAGELKDVLFWAITAAQNGHPGVPAVLGSLCSRIIIHKIGSVPNSGCEKLL
jgi:hypothetical protein